MCADRRLGGLARRGTGHRRRRRRRRQARPPLLCRQAITHARARGARCRARRRRARRAPDAAPGVCRTPRLAARCVTSGAAAVTADRAADWRRRCRFPPKSTRTRTAAIAIHLRLMCEVCARTFYLSAVVIRTIHHF